MRGNILLKFIDRYIGIALVWFLGLFAEKNSALPSAFKAILIIKLSALGDTILLVPVLRALKKAYPGATVSAIGTKINQDVLKACPYLDEVSIINPVKLCLNPFSIRGLFGKEQLELALDFDQWTRISPLIAFMSGAKYRVGFNTEGQYRHFLYTKSVEHSRAKHELECFFDIAKSVGVKNEDKKLEFWIDQNSAKRAGEALLKLGIKEGESFVVFHPETPAHAGQRQWPAENYIELGKLILRLNKYKIIVGGTEAERAEKAKIAAGLAPSGHVLPALSLPEYAAVLSKAQMLICGNTGIMHLGSALDIPVIALHGPTDPLKWGPLGNKSRVVKSGLECSPCLYLGFEYACPTNKCMKAISAEAVFAEIQKVANSVRN